jgi:hypothetical protein
MIFFGGTHAGFPCAACPQLQSGSMSADASQIVVSEADHGGSTSARIECHMNYKQVHGLTSYFLNFSRSHV